jgi:hypothetical protein
MTVEQLSTISSKAFENLAAFIPPALNPLAWGARELVWRLLRVRVVLRFAMFIPCSLVGRGSG